MGVAMRGMGIIASGENPNSRLEDIVLHPALGKSQLPSSLTYDGKSTFLRRCHGIISDNGWRALQLIDHKDSKPLNLKRCPSIYAWRGVG